MIFGTKYKLLKTTHTKKELEDNDVSWGWAYEVYKQRYFFFIPLGWDFMDSFEGEENAKDYIRYQLHPTYYSKL